MAKKGKRRREERQKKRQLARAGDSDTGLDAEGDEESPPAPAPAAQKRPPRRKHKKKSGTRIRVSPWWFAGAGTIAAVGIVVFMIATSGSSGSSGPPRATAEPDPRVAGLTPAETLQLEAGGSDVDAYFNPTRLTAPAGEAVEIIVENTGSLSHNLTLSGLDAEYGTSDDWESDPVLIAPGDEGRLVFKIDQAGTYPFRCSLHPQVQFGELVLQ